MRQLLPELDDEVDPMERYATDARPAPADRPWVLANMVASVDGATSVEGRSGGLGGPADRAAFFAIRAVADVILVAAGTARAEGYGPPKASPAVQEQRVARGQAPTPRLALVTRKVDLDPEARFFSDQDNRTLVVAPQDAPAERLAAVAGVADVLTVGTAGVDLGAALRALRDDGAQVVLTEGGPNLLSQLAAADLLDELCVTISPCLVAGESARMIHGATAPGGVDALRLERILEEDGTLLLRYVRERDA